MERTFIFGVSVSGDNFTDRIEETRRLIQNFENGLNTILISPRRTGKTSLVNKVCDSFAGNQNICIARMDIYDCRNEYDFYNKFATSILRATSSRMEQILETAKEFLYRVIPQVSISPDPTIEYSFSIKINPKDMHADEILSLPERIAAKKGIRIVVCIDEFQQIGDFPDSIQIQKRLRGAWQHQKFTSYCLYGSRKHMMENLFQSRRMPFYQFGDTIHLGNITTKDWITYIQSRFQYAGKKISETLAEQICTTVCNFPSYVQQLAWNVLNETEVEATDENIKDAIEKLLIQCSPLFIQQTENLTSYQMNFLRAVCSGITGGFGKQSVSEEFGLGSKSNISRLIKSLTNKELIDRDKNGIIISDPVFRIWFERMWITGSKIG